MRLILFAEWNVLTILNIERAVSCCPALRAKLRYLYRILTTIRYYTTYEGRRRQAKRTELRQSCVRDRATRQEESWRQRQCRDVVIIIGIAMRLSM